MNVIQKINSGLKYSDAILLNELTKELLAEISKHRESNFNMYELKNKLIKIVDDKLTTKITVTNTDNFNWFRTDSIQQSQIAASSMIEDNITATNSRTSTLENRISALETSFANLTEIRDRQ